MRNVQPYIYVLVRYTKDEVRQCPLSAVPTNVTIVVRYIVGQSNGRPNNKRHLFLQRWNEGVPLLVKLY